MFHPPSMRPVIERTRKMIRRRIAELWQHIYRAQHTLGLWGRYRSVAFSTALLLLVSASAYLSPIFQTTLESHYETAQALEGLSNLILNLGSALIGAAAIVTSLVLFAMQVNIERMPHGLFRRLSGDLKLLGAFALAFLLAIGVATLSTFVTQSRLAHIVLATFWSVVLILLSFMYAYGRALALVNPLKQLRMLVQDTKNDLRSWARRAQRAMPLLEPEESESAEEGANGNSTHDVARAAFFQLNSGWTNGAKRSVRHAMSFARRYAEQGDHEVSGAALSAVISINAYYIESKGKTFYANNPFFDNPYSSDHFINDTLEHLRQDVQSGIARGDEQQIEHALQTMAMLVQVYLGIDYSSQYAEKSHAQLAAGYLTSAVQAIVPHGMADVLMEGQRLMGRSAQYILADGNLNAIVPLSEKIALVACAGCAKEDYRPVTVEGITQLANLTFDLLRTRGHDIHFAVRKIRQDIVLVTKLFLNRVADTPLSRSHSTVLGPYYSSTSTDGLRARLTALANALSEAQADDADAKSVIRNIEHWADALYQTEKEVLLATIQAKSHFVFDIIHWITGITEILLAVSNAPACEDHSQEKLQKHARWLIATLSWIPDDKESVAFVENFQMTDTLLEAAMGAHSRGCDDIASEIGNQLLSWAVKGGRHETGWGILQRGILGAAAVAIASGDDRVAELKTSLVRFLRESGVEQEIRHRAATEILERAETLYQRGHWSSRIDMAIEQSDHEKLRPLLEDVAGLLVA